MIIAILFALVGPAFAGNYVPAAKAHIKTYWDKSTCEAAEGGECLDSTSCPLDECEIKTVSGKKQLVRDNAKIKDREDKEKAEAKKKKDRDDRKARLEVQCANAEGLVKELCDHVLDK